MQNGSKKCLEKRGKLFGKGVENAYKILSKKGLESARKRPAKWVEKVPGKACKVVWDIPVQYV